MMGRQTGDQSRNFCEFLNPSQNFCEILGPRGTMLNVRFLVRACVVIRSGLELF